MSLITFDIFDEEKIAEHIAVGASVYSSPEVTNSHHLSWKHLRNPSGPSTSVSLRNELGFLVGRSFIHPRPFFIYSDVLCRGATITDLVVKPTDRNAAALIGMTRAIKAPDGFDIVVHTSNDVSDLIYRRLFKFPIAFSLVASGLPIRVSNVLKPHCNNHAFIRVMEALVAPLRWALRGLAIFTASVSGISFGAAPNDCMMSELFEGFRQGAGPHFERSQRFLSWRFSEGPIFNGKIEWVWRHGQCLGYLVFKRVLLGGLQVLVIMDAGFRRRLTLIEAVALKFMAARLAIKGACDAIFSLVNTKNPALKWLGSFPFILIPDRYLPHATPIFIHASNEYRSLETQGGMFFTLADLDYF